ncbi:hypothetical protein [Neptuniibacter sp. QD37_11]|uniref:hypothetical protein n=1 Tax=Neptuniibacter sp. QD37_11 TaxID=3398209 RepID=UPI0039F5BD6E
MYRSALAILLLSSSTASALQPPVKITEPACLSAVNLNIEHKTVVDEALADHKKQQVLRWVEGDSPYLTKPDLVCEYVLENYWVEAGPDSYELVVRKTYTGNESIGDATEPLAW